MLGVAVASVLLRVGDLLQDETHDRWKSPELLRWVNDAATAIITRRPTANAKTISHSLTQGVKQSLPDGALALIDIPFNETAEVLVRATTAQLLRDADPNWRRGVPTDRVTHYLYDPAAPRDFWVYPPAAAGVFVELIYGAVPTTEAKENGYLQVPVEYLEAVVNYVCYRAHSKDIESAQGAVATAYYNAFTAALQEKTA